MPALTKITLTFDNGLTQDIAIGPQATKITTPFGIVDLTASVPKAPTGPEVAANPGEYDGTANDPTMTMAPTFWDGAFVPPAPPKHTMADLFRLDPDLARAVWAANLRAPLDESRLSTAQKRRMGL